ncbi:MAG TPA: type 1 glutamine amidotransferase domain-containing protein [Acetobacteraceae bacterium]|nr:type 1 glutamine amidotransferase domain-containing protein [Acetobacteraceae bacterium]
MASDMRGRRIAVLATDGVEQVELTEPVRVLQEAGAQVTVISPKPGQIQAMNHDEKGDKLPVDQPLADTSPDAFDGLVLPGGVANPDKLRVDEKAVAFVRHFVQSGKPIAAICHGPWTLIEAGAVKGRRMTSWPSLRTDLRNAGADWVDEVCVRDGPLVTARKPDDLPAFAKAVVELFSETPHRHAA